MARDVNVAMRPIAHSAARTRGAARRSGDWLGPALLVGAFGVLWWLEGRRPLRPAVESKSVRMARNLSVAALSAAALRMAERPLVDPLAAYAERRRWGLLARLRLPHWIEFPLALALMDYTLYLWHILTHRIEFLWRFHQVHHVDLDLDASTATRFHLGEMLLSVPWRAAQVVLIGVGPRALASWRLLTLLSVLFHHSNVRLPIAAERRLVRLIVTPRMHGIHHSTIAEETGSNWSSGLTVWDRLHGTLRLDVPQSAVKIGVPAYRTPEVVTLVRLLRMPFGPQRPAWPSHSMTWRADAAVADRRRLAE